MGFFNSESKTMNPVPLFGLGLQGKSTTVTSQNHLNLYAEITPEGEKSRIAFHNAPGLILFTSFGDTPVRGWIPVGDFIYVVHRGTFYEVNNAGVKTIRGTIPTTTGRVQMAFNGTQIALVDGGGVRFFNYTIATLTLSTVTVNVISTPIDITFQDGYGILFYADGRFQITAGYAFQTLDALEFATAESNPDGLVRGISDHGEIVLLGASTVEFWGNTGARDFPYANQRGSTLEFGLAAPWSCVKYNDSLCGLFKNTMGQVQVMVMQGHALRKISSPDLDYLINNYGSVSDATGYSYMLAGHPMYQINFPSAGKTWLYDATTEMWSALQSGLSGVRHRGELLIDYLNKPRIADFATGDIYTLSADALTDNGTPIAREIITRHLSGTGGRLAVHKLQVDFEVGVGLISGQGSSPQVMLQISKDNGKTYGNERWTTLGAIGAYLTRAIWQRLGASYDWTFKLRITDPVKVVITAAYMDVERRK